MGPGIGRVTPTVAHRLGPNRMGSRGDIGRAQFMGGYPKGEAVGVRKALTPLPMRLGEVVSEWA
jgi:hypothetical protein